MSMLKHFFEIGCDPSIFDGLYISQNQKLCQQYMGKFPVISISLKGIQKPTKENFYHGILLGILGYKSGWTVRSSKESGNGFRDIFIQIDDSDLGIIIEVKYSENNDLKSECKKALQQISQKNYTEELYQNGIHYILKYGIVCQRKRCCVLLEKA